MYRVLFIFLTFMFTSGTAHSERSLTITPETFSHLWHLVLPGDVVTFMPGVYRQSLILNLNKNWSAEIPTIFKAKVPGSVLVKGSDVISGWKPHKVNHIFWHRLSSEPSQVFIDDNLLKQVGGTIFNGFPQNMNSPYHKLHKKNGSIWPGRLVFTGLDTMPNNSFYYDLNKEVLFIKTNIDLSRDESLVEVSVRSRSFFAGKADGITLDGLSFMHSNLSVRGRGAAVQIIGSYNTFKNINVAYSDLVGIQMVGDHNKLIHSTSRMNGQLGVAVKGRENTIKYVRSSENNYRGFNKWWEAGGFKFIGNGGLIDSIFTHNQALNNNGDGIWFDNQNDNNFIASNVSAYNSGFGIHFEISTNGNISENLVFANGQRGIYIINSSGCLIQKNLSVMNGLGGIVVVESPRLDRNKGYYESKDNIVRGNTIAWNKGPALIMPKNQSKKNFSDNNVFISDSNSEIFNLGFKSKFQSGIRDLTKWQAITSYDLESSSVKSIPPDDLLRDIANKKVQINWSEYLVMP